MRGRNAFERLEESTPEVLVDPGWLRREIGGSEGYYESYLNGYKLIETHVR